jgi:hypothetical protein
MRPPGFTGTLERNQYPIPNPARMSIKEISGNLAVYVGLLAYLLAFSIRLR